jgi:hypothetical protein
VIFKVKKTGDCFKDLYYKLLKLFTYEYANILRFVLIIGKCKKILLCSTATFKKKKFSNLFQSGLARMRAYRD